MTISLPSYTPGEHYETYQLIPAANTVQDFIVRLLRQRLNSEIAFANALADAADEPMKPVDQVLPAPAKVTDAFINCALVGLHVNRHTKGRRLIENKDCVLSVYLVDKRIEDECDIPPAWRRGDLVTSIMEPFSGGYPATGGPSEPKYWHELIPLDMTVLPASEEFAGYSGVTLNFQLWQSFGQKFAPDAT